MKLSYNPLYADIDVLRQRAKHRIPKFAFEYLDEGCNEEVNLCKNTEAIRKVELLPSYINDIKDVTLKTELLGHVYDAPFGIAPVGLQGLIWPNSAEILAKAAFTANIPFVLSTVTTANIEKISELTEGRAWFQLYHPAEEGLRNDLLRRLEVAGYQVLVLLADVPSFGFRPKDIKNGLAMPPRMTLANVMQMLGCPGWLINTLWHGIPQFANLKPYMPNSLNINQLGQFMQQTFSGKLTESKIAQIRERWKGKIVLKGVTASADIEKAIQLGVDGVIVSNHGGRQLDAAQAAITSLEQVVNEYGGKIKIMMDSGVRSGVDIARTIATGAEFVFLGRTFMYAVAALGNEGGGHVINILMAQLKQLLEQVGAECPEELRRKLST